MVCSAATAEPLDDLAVARMSLAQPAAQAAERAADAQAEAARTVRPGTPSPHLFVSREAVADSSATVAGVELSLELDGRAGLERSAGAAAARAAGQAARHARTERVCAARAAAIDARHAEEVAAVYAATQKELAALAAEVDRLVAGRERAAFDAERVRLRLAVHGRRADAASAVAAAAKAELASWIGPFTGPLLVEPAMPDAAWIEAARASHPDLARTEQASVAARRGARVAERWWVPAVSVQAAWRREVEAGGDAASGHEVGLSVELPIADRRAPQRARAHAEIARLAAEADGLRRAMDGRVRGATAELAALVDSTAVDALSTLDRARRRYRSGVAPLAELIEVLDAVLAEATTRLDRSRRLRRLRLELACAVGAFPEPALQALTSEEK